MDTISQRLLQDKEAIYLGNLFTVEADLSLPNQGKNGSEIQWHSQYPHLVDETGKVSRPYAGTGNRTVVLTASLTLEGQQTTREFQATVLERESILTYVRILPVEMRLAQGTPFVLPGVVILETDTGAFTTLPVQWENIPDFAALPPNTYEVSGKAPDRRFPALLPTARVHVVSAADAPQKKKMPLLQTFPLRDVQINGGIYKENMERMQHCLLHMDDDSLLYNFREAAGLDTRGAQPMTGWDAPECLLKGHTTGHYLSALALAYCSGGNEQAFGDKIKYMVTALAQCQDAMAKSGRFHPGFLSGYSEEQFDLLEEYVVYPKIWAPYYTLHKIMAGLLDCWEFAQNSQALEICRRLGEWVHGRLLRCGEDRRQKMWSMYIAGEFGGMNEVMARLFRFVPQPEFMEAAGFFDNDKLFYPMAQNVDTLGGIHANQHIPQIIGALEMYNRGAPARYYEIAQNFWDMTTAHHCYCIGGTGEGEMFRERDKIGAYLTEKTAESCASYNMLKLTGGLFCYTPQGRYMDYYEKAMLNHVVSSHDKSGPTGGSTYFMPLKPGGKKEFDYQENSCCHGTGLESHLRYQEHIYHHAGDTLYVSLFIPSVLHWREKDMKFTQTGNFLETQKLSLLVEGNGFVRLHIRIPGWLKQPVDLQINGQAVGYTQEDGYCIFEKEFQGGDRVEVKIPFSLEYLSVPDAEELVTVQYGPVVLAAADDKEQFLQLPAGKTAEEVLRPTASLLEFDWNGTRFFPAFALQDSPYHVYLKKG